MRLSPAQRAEIAAWAENLELALTGRPPGTPRGACSFCHQVRSRLDDNHAPGCAYLAYFPCGDT